MNNSLIADSDPGFTALRPELREMLRQVELEGREILEKQFSTLPGDLAELLRGMVNDLMPSFMVAQLPFYQIIDAVFPQYVAELLRRQAARALDPEKRLN